MTARSIMQFQAVIVFTKKTVVRRAVKMLLVQI